MQPDLGAVAADFQRDGACVVRMLLDEHEIARLREGAEQNLSRPSERALEGGGGAGSGRFFEDFRNWTRIASYEEVIRGSRLGEAAVGLMGTRTARLHHDHLLVKEPGTTIPDDVAPGPAVLRPRRPRHGLVLDPARPGPAREHARVRGRVARRAHVVHAAQLLSTAGR